MIADRAGRSHIADYWARRRTMFVMAKLLIALGFRRDLAIIIHGHPQGAHLDLE